MYKNLINTLRINIEELNVKVTEQTRTQQQEMEQLRENDDANRLQLKLLNNQNLQLKQDNANLVDKLQIVEASLQDKDNELGMTKMQLNDQLRLCEEIKNQLEMSCQGLIKMKESFIKLEVDKDHRLSLLANQIEEIKESRDGLTDLYETQLEILRKSLLSTHSEKDSELIYQLSQRDSLIQNLKKEVKVLKTKQKSKGASNQTIEDNILENIDEDFDKLLNKARKFNELQEKMIETNAANQKTEGWNLVLIKQSAENEKTMTEMRQQLDELLEKDGQDAKVQRIVSQQTAQIQKLKQQNKQLEIEVSQLKVSWISPDRYKSELQ